MPYMDENDRKELLQMIDETIWLLNQQKYNIRQFKPKPLKDMKNPRPLGTYRRTKTKKK